MLEDLDHDLDVLEAAVEQLASLAVAATGSAEAAILALLSAAEAIQSQGDAETDTIIEMFRLIHRD